MISKTHKISEAIQMILSIIRDFFKYLWLKLLLVLTEMRQRNWRSKHNRYKRLEIDQKHPSDGGVGLKEIPEVKGLPIVGTLFHLLAAGAAPK